MCAQQIDATAHQHVVDLHSRQLMCACRACYLLFTDGAADLRYRAVPDRYLSYEDFAMGPAQWEALEIPVGLAFFFHNTVLGKTIAFYPGPAGVTESELPLQAWETVLAANPGLGELRPDIEAVLIRAGTEGYQCFLVPIDACYELAGRLRRGWQGFDGGRESRESLDTFFSTVTARSRSASASAPVTR